MKIEERDTFLKKYYEALHRLHELDDKEEDLLKSMDEAIYDNKDVTMLRIKDELQAIQDKYSDAHKDLFDARKKIYEYAGIEL